MRGYLMIRLCISFGAALLCTRCTSVKSFMGFDHGGPDEFGVVPLAPLSQPREYNNVPEATIQRPAAEAEQASRHFPTSYRIEKGEAKVQKIDLSTTALPRMILTAAVDPSSQPTLAIFHDDESSEIESKLDDKNAAGQIDHERLLNTSAPELASSSSLRLEHTESSDKPHAPGFAIDDKSGYPSTNASRTPKLKISPKASEPTLVCRNEGASCPVPKVESVVPAPPAKPSKRSKVRRAQQVKWEKVSVQRAATLQERAFEEKPMNDDEEDQPLLTVVVNEPREVPPAKILPMRPISNCSPRPTPRSPRASQQRTRIKKGGRRLQRRQIRRVSVRSGRRMARRKIVHPRRVGVRKKRVVTKVTTVRS